MTSPLLYSNSAAGGPYDESGHYSNDGLNYSSNAANMTTLYIPNAQDGGGDPMVQESDSGNENSLHSIG